MKPGSAPWWQQHEQRTARPKRPRRDGLTLERILDAALVIVDGDGLESLTMRRLAGELGCAHTSLYRHVQQHDEVIVLLVDRVLGEISLSGAPDVTPRERAEAALRSYRDTLLAHQALAPAFLQGQLLGPHALAKREEGLSMMLAVGVDPSLAVRAWLTATHFVISSVAFESSGAGRTEADRSEMREYFEALDAATFPTLNALAVELNEVSADEEFELGLDALLSHIERLAAL